MPKQSKPEGKRYAIGLRTTKNLKDDLDAAAEESGRSLAQEVEHRLEMSFLREREIYGNPETEALLKTLAMTIRFVESATRKRWIDDGDTAAQAVAAVQGVIQALGIVPRPLLQEKLAQLNEGRFANHLNLALSLWGLKPEEIAEAYGAGKPHTKGPRK
jgi:hypothetical protein